VREQFIATQQEAAQAVVFQANSVYCAAIFLGALVIAVATYFEIRTIYVLVITYGQTCDKPLWLWLCVHSVLSILRELLNQPAKSILLAFHAVWTVYGYAWFMKVNTCKDTAPELYFWTQVILLVAAVILLATTLLPLAVYLTIMMLVFLVSMGLINNRKAARPGTLDRLEVVEYRADIFAPIDDPNDPRPAPECPCCFECFDANEVIVKTPCQHYFHRRCLESWLKLAKTCPLCRNDIEEDVWARPRPEVTDP
jgi:hypothetical protein